MLLSKQTIADRVKVLGAEITADYRDRPLALIAVLKGSFIFFADLVREMDLSAEIDFIRVKSYGNYTVPGGISLTKEPELNLKGKDIILVEDIVDTGKTAAWLNSYFKKYEPESVHFCALINKTHRRAENVVVTYCGFDVPQKDFLVGYGLDYAGKFRTLPDIYLKESYHG